jgi:ATP-dependent Lon protease
MELTPSTDSETQKQGVLANESSAPAAAQGAKGQALASKPLPADALAIIPLRSVVLFPGVIAPVTVGRESSVAAAQEAARGERRVGFLLQRDPAQDSPRPEELFWVGTTGPIMRYVTGADGAHHLVVQGQSRFRVLEFLEGWPFLVARVSMIEEVVVEQPRDPEIDARFMQLKSQAAEAVQLLPQAPDELAAVIQSIGSPGQLADMVANFLDVKPEEKQQLLETFDLRARLDRVLALLGQRVGVLRLSKEIGEQTQKAFEERQREHVLREQMRQIQKELGEGDDTAAEVAELKKAIEDAGMPEDVHKHAMKEFKRLERMPEAGGEYSMLRSYLEWLTELPWKDEPQKAIDIAEARKVLDEDHYGLEKIKRRILEHLAVRKLNPEGKSPILCFVGPPGVGKTSLGQSIARATGRPFQRVALGGTHDEAEIRFQIIK